MSGGSDDSKIVGVTLNAQLCNQLFELAAAWAHARRHGLTLVIHPWHAAPANYCRFWLGEWMKSAESPPRVRAPIWKEPAFSYTPIPRAARHLVGYFQSERYFREFRDEIRERMMPAASFQRVVQSVWAARIGSLEGSCAIHVRRGDYISNPANRIKHGILTEEYYRRAMELARAAGATRFLVFSDDLDWCRAQPWLATPDCVPVDEQNGEAALFLLTQIPMLIGSNSTFSWWGAYLGVPKQVWMPDRWFGPSGPSDTEDVYVEGWTRVPVTGATGAAQP